MFKHRSFWAPFLLQTTTVNLPDAGTLLLIKKAYLDPKGLALQPTPSLALSFRLVKINNATLLHSLPGQSRFVTVVLVCTL